MNAGRNNVEERFYRERARRVEVEKKLAETKSALDERERQFAEQSKLLKALEIAYDPGSKAAMKRAACNLITCGATSNNRTNILVGLQWYGRI